MDRDNNHYSLPDIPIANVDDVLAAAQAFELRDSSGNFFYIFPFPTLNCSGTVSEFRFCYSDERGNINIDLGTDLSVFTLLLLEQQDEINYIVTRTISVHSTPTSTKCRTRPRLGPDSSYCCDTNPASFDIPATGFAYGIAGGAGLLFYRDQLVEHYRTDTANAALQVGSMYAVGSQIQTDRNLRLIQFTVGKHL